MGVEPEGFINYITGNHIRLGSIDDGVFKETHPHHVGDVNIQNERLEEITAWCKENIIDHEYSVVIKSSGTFYFEFITDATAFKLRWL